VNPGGAGGQLLRVKVALKRRWASRVSPRGERVRVVTVEEREGTARQALGRFSAERGQGRRHTGKADENCTSVLYMATSGLRERGGATRNLRPVRVKRRVREYNNSNWPGVSAAPAKNKVFSPSRKLNTVTRATTAKSCWVSVDTVTRSAVKRMPCFHFHTVSKPDTVLVGDDD
jgi:hypothetical protein